MSWDAVTLQSPRQQKPIKKTLCATLKKETNWKCLLLTVIICACVSLICWCHLSVVRRVVVDFGNFPIASSTQTSRCSGGYVYIPSAFAVMLYLVYLIECWHCAARVHLSSSNRVRARDIYSRVQLMCQTQPIVWWKAVCYHYVRRSRHLQRYRNGDTYTTTQIYYERINSRSSGSTFSFARCGYSDISNDLVDLENYPLTKVSFSKVFAFANVDAATEFEEQRSRFFRDHERFDDYMEMSEGLDLLDVSFKENLVAFADDDKKLPWYVSRTAFWMASFLLLSWPLRILVEYKTAHVHFRITKLFGINYPLPGGESSANMISTAQPYAILRRADDSCTEIEEQIVRRNYSIIPSYSEALLLSTANNMSSENGLLTSIDSTSISDANGNSIAPIHLPRLSNQEESLERRRYSCLGFFNRSSGCNRSSFPSMRTSISNDVPLSSDRRRKNFLMTVYRHRSSDTPLDNCPPDYDEAVENCLPLYNSIRRSLTDRDINGRVRLFKKSVWPNTHIETAL